jgi:serine/threonine protein kinase
MDKAKRKPVVSSRLPKAFSQPNKLRKRKNPDIAEAA